MGVSLVELNFIKANKLQITKASVRFLLKGNVPIQNNNAAKMKYSKYEEKFSQHRMISRAASKCENLVLQCNYTWSQSHQAEIP